MANSASEYHPHPVKGASSAFAILYAATAVLAIFSNIKYKAWHLFWLLPCTSIIFTAGFICLEYNAFHPTAFAPSDGLLYSGAPILMACLCMGFFQLIATQPGVPRLWSTVVYGLAVLFISVIISLTANGTSNFANPHASPKLRQSDLAILKASLVLLLFGNIGFLGVLGAFHRRCSLLKAFAGDANRTVRLLAFTLYAAGTLMLARNIFRTVQIFSPGYSPAWWTEAYFWVFDASPLLICTLLLNVLHPARLAPMTAEGRGCSA